MNVWLLKLFTSFQQISLHKSISVNDWLTKYFTSILQWCVGTLRWFLLRFTLHKFPLYSAAKTLSVEFLGDKWRSRSKQAAVLAILDKPFCTYLPRNLDKKDLFVSTWLFDVVVHYSNLNIHLLFQRLKAVRLSCSLLSLWWKFGSMGFFLIPNLNLSWSNSRLLHLVLLLLCEKRGWPSPLHKHPSGSCREW